MCSGTSTSIRVGEDTEEATELRVRRRTYLGRRNQTLAVCAAVIALSQLGLYGSMSSVNVFNPFLAIIYRGLLAILGVPGNGGDNCNFDRVCYDSRHILNWTSWIVYTAIIRKETFIQFTTEIVRNLQTNGNNCPRWSNQSFLLNV